MIQEANLHWRYLDTECNLVMPWYTLPTLEWLKRQPTKSWDVYEYGGGYSTIWWRLNCKSLQGVESDEIWAKSMGINYSADKSSYVNKCQGAFDCIIVDGLYREECTFHCVPHLKEGGVLIIDNYEEPFGFDCTKINELLKYWTKTVFQQPNHSNWRTAIFIKP